MANVISMNHPEILFRHTAPLARLLKTAGLWLRRSRRSIVRTACRLIQGNSTASASSSAAADMDALPIHEQTGWDFMPPDAQRDARLRHDATNGRALGGAISGRNDGNLTDVVVIFQPAERSGVARRRCAKDANDGPWGIQEILWHATTPGIPASQFSIRPRPFFAATRSAENRV